MPNETSAPGWARFRAIVHGRVQGVNFRYYTCRQAERLGVVGYVRNQADGTVEVVAEGTPQATQALLAWLHHGPPQAYVTRVEATWLAPNREFHSFEVRY